MTITVTMLIIMIKCAPVSCPCVHGCATRVFSGATRESRKRCERLAASFGLTTCQLGAVLSINVQSISNACRGDDTSPQNPVGHEVSIDEMVNIIYEHYIINRDFKMCGKKVENRL